MKEDVISIVCYIRDLEYEGIDADKFARVANTALALLNELMPDNDLDIFEIQESISRVTSTIQRYFTPQGISFSLDLFEEIKRHLLLDLRTFEIINPSYEALTGETQSTSGTFSGKHKGMN